MPDFNLKGRQLRIAAALVGVVIVAAICTFLIVLWKADYRSRYDALHLAADSGDVEGVRQLLAGGLPVDLRSAVLGFTPLHVAADRGHVEVARLLLERGASVKLRDENGNTPLHLTAAQSSGRAQPKSTETQRNDVARLLLKYGADPNAANHFGNTPLHAAIHSDDVDLVALLLEHGADPTKTNSTGDSPIDYAGFIPQSQPDRIRQLLETHRPPK